MSDTKEPRRFWIVDESDLFESHRDALSEQQFREQRGYSSIIEVIDAAWAEARIREFKDAYTKNKSKLMLSIDKIDQLQSRVAELEAALEDFVDRVEAGYSGMFGHQTVSPEQDCYEWLEQEVKPLRKALGKG